MSAQLELAFKAKTKGIALVATHNAAWLEEARAIAREICRQSGSVTAEDVRDKIHTAPNHPNAWGAIFKSTEFTPIGFEPGRHVQGHCRVIRRWRLRD